MVPLLPHAWAFSRDFIVWISQAARTTCLLGACWHFPLEPSSALTVGQRLPSKPWVPRQPQHFAHAPCPLFLPLMKTMLTLSFVRHVLTTFGLVVFIEFSEHYFMPNLVCGLPVSSCPTPSVDTWPPLPKSESPWQVSGFRGIFCTKHKIVYRRGEAFMSWTYLVSHILRLTHRWVGSWGWNGCISPLSHTLCVVGYMDHPRIPHSAHSLWHLPKLKQMHFKEI